MSEAAMILQHDKELILRPISMPDKVTKDFIYLVTNVLFTDMQDEESYGKILDRVEEICGEYMSNNKKIYLDEVFSYINSENETIIKNFCECCEYPHDTVDDMLKEYSMFYVENLYECIRFILNKIGIHYEDSDTSLNNKLNKRSWVIPYQIILFPQLL